MKNQFIYFIVVIFSISVSLTACKRDKEDEQPQTPNPALTANISVSSPEENASYTLGEEVHINATVTADFQMHGYHVYIINLTADDTVFYVHPHAHGTSYDIHEHWTNDVTEHSDMKLKIIATLDHDGTTAVKEVPFHCHPM